MVKTNDSSKVLKALQIVLNDCLSVKSDDTLKQKLYTFLKHDLDLSPEENQLVLNCVQKSIDLSSEELKTNNDCNDWSLIAVKLRICGSLLANEDLFIGEQTCLQFIERMATEVVNSNKSWLKCSFFQCLNDISEHKSGRNWILNSNLNNSINYKTFPQILWHFFNKTETIYTEREVRKLFICLLNDSLVETKSTQHLDEVITKLVSAISPSNIGVINDLLLSIEAKSEFINKYDLNDVLINCIDIWIKNFDQKLPILSQVLGLCVDTDDKAFEICDKLISSNHLTALIAFLTNFIKINSSCDKNIKKIWFNYTIGSFAINSPKINCFEMSSNEIQLLERLSDKTLRNYCLNQMTKLNSKVLDDKQIDLINEILLDFIKSNHQKPEMRKILIQCFSVLETIAFDPRLHSKDNFFDICSQLLPLISVDFKLTLLKNMRILFEDKTLDFDIGLNVNIIDVLEQLNDILNESEISLNNWELKDSVLEVIYAVFSSLTKPNVKLLSQNDLPVLPKLITSVISLWMTDDDNLCPPIRSTIVSILLIVCLTESEPDINKLNVSKKSSLNLRSLSSLLLTDELTVKEMIIRTLKQNIDLLLNIEEENYPLFSQIITILCTLSVKDLDEDLQTNALQLLFTLFDKHCEKKSISSTMQTFFKSYFFHTIYHLITSSEYLFKVKQKSVEIIEFIKRKFNSIEDNNGITIFNSVIAEELTIDSNLDQSLKAIITVDWKTTSDFFVNFDANAFNDMGSKDIPELSVLDDILSVSLIDTNILIDCY